VTRTYGSVGGRGHYAPSDPVLDFLHAGMRMDYGLTTHEFVDGGFRVADVSVPEPVPTVSEWGLVTIALLILTAGTLVRARCQLGGA